MSCLQKNQMGSEPFVIVRFQVGKPEVRPEGMRIVPVSKPSPSGSQGLANEDWVTEWFPGLDKSSRSVHCLLDTQTSYRLTIQRR